MPSPLRLLRLPVWAFRRLLLDNWRSIESELSPAPPAAPPPRAKPKKKPKLPPAEARLAGPRKFDWRPLVVMITGAFALTLPVYYSERATFAKLVPFDALDARWQLWAYGWEAGLKLACYVLLPLLAVLAMPRERVREYHLGLGSLRALPWLSAALALVTALAAAKLCGAASLDLPGADYVPGRSLAERVDALALLGLQLVAAEVLFRGFLLHGVGRTLGDRALLAVAVPYCMIQYGGRTPFAEVMEALPAGVLLALLARETRSIWCGVLIQLAATTATMWIGTGHAPLVAGVIATGALLAGGWARRLAALRVDWRPLVILGGVALSLSLQEYYGDRGTFARFFPYDADDTYWHLKAFVWWSGWRVFGYVILPLGIVALMPGERIRDYHLTFQGFFKHLWIYVVLYLLILPAILAFGQTPSFYKTYPFYKLSNRSSFDFWCWQGLYAIQFLSLEFFFRGFMLAGLKRSLGVHAIFVMIVPYCMIHYGKPLPETLGAIFAGVILGTLALRTRSIWCGALIHVSVALTMDWLGLHHCPPAGEGACPT